MEAKELRIGNFIKNLNLEYDDLATADYCIVKSFSDVVIHWTSPSLLGECHSGFFNETVEPIPLTEEWLLKLGADKVKDIVFVYSRFKLFFKHNYKYWYVLDLNNSTYITKVEFVHEWQNFVFVMDGKELELKTHLENL